MAEIKTRTLKDYLLSIAKKVELAEDDAFILSDSEDAFVVKKVRASNVSAGDTEISAHKSNVKRRVGSTFPMSFTSDAVYGTYIVPMEGNITKTTTNAKLGVRVLLFHQSSTVPEVPNTFKKLTGSSEYVTDVPNIFDIQYISENLQTYTIQQLA